MSTTNCPRCGAPVAELGTTCPSCGYSLSFVPAPSVDDAEQLAFVRVLKTRRPWMTWSITGAIAAVFALQVLFGAGASQASLGRMGALSGRAVREGQVWQLLSAAFLHVGILHVIMNLAALTSLGSLLEVLLGRRRVLVAFVLTAIAGNAAAAVSNSEQMTAGASGGLWGLMTLTAVLILRPNALVPRNVARRARPGMTRALLINGGISLLPGISMVAHLGGGLLGALLGLSGILHRGVRPAWTRDEGAPEPSPLWLAIAFYGCIAVSALSVGAAIVQGRPWELLRPPTMERVALPPSAASVLIPVELRARREEALQPAGLEHVFGDLVRDGVLVSVIVIPQPDRVPDPAEALDALKDLQKRGGFALVPGFRQQSLTLEEKGRPVLVETADAPSGAAYTEYGAFAGNDFVRVAVYRKPERIPAWNGLDRLVYESLEPRE